MEGFNKKRLKTIQTIFEERTGTNVTASPNNLLYNGKRLVAVAGAMICLLTLSAFAYSKFSGIAGDELAFYSCYKGEGIFEIVITNFSDKELKLQEQIKMMRWSTGEEVAGNAEKIVFENRKIEAHSEEIIRIDLSEGYNIADLEKPLPSGDWYYFVLTNNDFAFGQDWMCSVDFVESSTDSISKNSDKPPVAEKEEVVYASVLKYGEWTWPTVSEKISTAYGDQENGAFSDHINIAGTMGDKVYAVADGTVLKTGFDATYGYYILMNLGEDITVKYGHLKKIFAQEGEQVSQGQEIATLGKSGMATGPNLFFAVYEMGETVNPLSE